MTEMEERVARAIEDGYGHQPCASLRIEVARAVIEAMLEPTEAMVDAVLTDVSAERVWRAMVRAALGVRDEGRAGRRDY